MTDMSPYRAYPFVYLATPYRAYPDGLDAAAEAAARLAGWLVDHGLEVYSPICHGHAIERYVTVADPRSDFWLDRQRPFMAAAKGLLIGCLAGWGLSQGIKRERDYFARAGKPEFRLNPVHPEIPSRLRHLLGETRA